MGNLMHRGKGSFTHVENTIFFDYNLSAKATGVYCQIRALETNPNWTFTISGLASLFKDGIDTIKAALKELEKHGFLIRARMRDENGRYLSAENSLWVTLDDPSNYDVEVTELVSRGYTIVSKREITKVRSDGDYDEKGEEPQVASTCGFSTSGSATCGKSDAINYLSNQQFIESNPSLLSPDDPADEEGEGEGDFVQFDKGEFSKSFELLCEMSIKPVSSLKFKRDAYVAWKRRLADGCEEQQILDAYAAYAESYRKRNGDDAKLAKNLIRWLEADGGLGEFADKPFSPELLVTEGGPLSMERLADKDPDFAKLWNNVQTQLDVKRSILRAANGSPSEAETRKAFTEDEYCQRLYTRAEEYYDRYLRAFESHQNRRE